MSEGAVNGKLVPIAAALEAVKVAERIALLRQAREALAAAGGDWHMTIWLSRVSIGSDEPAKLRVPLNSAQLGALIDEHIVLSEKALIALGFDQ